MKVKRFWKIAKAAVILLLIAQVPRVAVATGKSGNHFMPASAAPAPGPNKLAILVGINNYKYPEVVSPLAGSINDVEDIMQVLTTKFEFPRQNIVVLKNEQATHAAIITALRNLIAKAKPGDIVVFHYSGHGSQMKDVTHKKISGLDETIVPYDSRDPKGTVFDISGAELHGLLLQLAKKTQNVTFILDSCHSGTLVRDIGATARSVPPDTRTPPRAPPDYAVATARALGQTDDDTPLKYAFIAAATSKESAYEHLIQGQEHGALTYFLAQQLRTAKAGATYRDVMDSVIGNVTANYPAQHPQLEGTEADQHVFGDGSSLAGSYVEVLSVEGPRATLGVGAAEGATLGSIYAVYPPGSKKFAPPEKPVATVQLTAVDDFTSEGNIVSGSNIATSSRAVEREHRYGSAAMAVYIDGVEASPALKSIRDGLQALKYVSIVKDRKMCQVELRQVQGKVELRAADLSTLSPAVDANKAGAAHMIEEVKSWAKYFNVLSLRNAASGIDLQFTLTGSQTGDPIARVGKPDGGISEGENVEFTLQNNTERDLYVAILDLSSNGSINVIYPTEAGAKAVLTSGSPLTRSLGKTTLPQGRSRDTDILKVFASYKPIDLSSLTQEAVRGAPIEAGPPDPLQQLLNDSLGSTRGLAPQSTTLGTWTTIQRVLVVKRKGKG